ncbi:hypothetical protein [Usitatibacter rugosus]|nr:hypothetical protein [Usitatibacter rugosus]
MMIAMPIAGVIAGIGGIVLLCNSVFMATATYGLWTMQPWGAPLTTWVYALGIILSFLAMFPILPGDRFSVGNVVLQLVFIAIDVWILTYLHAYRPAVASQAYELDDLRKNSDL